MKKLFLFAVLAIGVLFNLSAQTGQLMIKKGSKGFYLDHSVAPKEGLYAIGRIYNVNAKYIAAYNQIELNKGLEIGQVIQIPLTDTNFTQKAKKGVPVYYTVGENEGLLKVSSVNNKVTIKDLRGWNGLANDNPAAGAKLIVGFLVTGQSPAIAANVPAKPVVKQEEKTVTKTEKTEEKQVAKTEPAEKKPVVKDKPVEEKPLVKAEPEKAKEIATEIKEQPKQTEPEFTKQEVAGIIADQGYFKKSFDQQVKAIPASKNATVTSGIFKTTSGWQDAKYYLLIDGVATGTIVKVTNPDNNKAIYAKVLGEMNGIRQNQGLDIRLSNAAASTLGVSDTEKFIVKVNY